MYFNPPEPFLQQDMKLVNQIDKLNIVADGRRRQKSKRLLKRLTRRLWRRYKGDEKPLYNRYKGYEL
jgi:hypothetical protein